MISQHVPQVADQRVVNSNYYEAFSCIALEHRLEGAVVRCWTAKRPQPLQELVSVALGTPRGTTNNLGSLRIP
eukprot:1377662-Amphidinium_carterae.1